MLVSSAFPFVFKIYLYTDFRGAVKAEIIPCEPDADNAAEGKSRNILPHSAIPKVCY
ncbi:MAG: hypothetical protein JWR61_5618 [Ferruginibacter sp.]|nr:hypothetical protein [Ferruginibacter sp.]